ncbi:MAG: hypothetical protein EOP06_03870 [Proteobacteria bacterium]|nr:MAG: hypothetical protein EOP06_03870 [Pseudomonadota bacterium]
MANDGRIYSGLGVACVTQIFEITNNSSNFKSDFLSLLSKLIIKSGLPIAKEVNLYSVVREGKARTYVALTAMTDPNDLVIKNEVIEKEQSLVKKKVHYVVRKLIIKKRLIQGQGHFEKAMQMSFTESQKFESLLAEVLSPIESQIVIRTITGVGPIAKLCSELLYGKFCENVPGLELNRTDEGANGNDFMKSILTPAISVFSPNYLILKDVDKTMVRVSYHRTAGSVKIIDTLTTNKYGEEEVGYNLEPSMSSSIDLRTDKDSDSIYLVRLKEVSGTSKLLWADKLIKLAGHRRYEFSPCEWVEASYVHRFLTLTSEERDSIGTFQEYKNVNTKCVEDKRKLIENDRMATWELDFFSWINNQIDNLPGCSEVSRGQLSMSIKHWAGSASKRTLKEE